MTYLTAEDSEQCRVLCESKNCALRLYLLDLKSYELEKKKTETQKNVLCKAEAAIKSTVSVMIKDNVFPGAPINWSKGLRKKLVASHVNVKQKSGEFFNL